MWKQENDVNTEINVWRGNTGEDKKSIKEKVTSSLVLSLAKLRILITWKKVAKIQPTTPQLITICEFSFYVHTLH